MDKSSCIFGNPIDSKTLRAAEKSKAKFIKKYGDDSGVKYEASFDPIKTLDFIKTERILLNASENSNATGNSTATFEPNALIVGNIRMGFGHYRISIAMASCAHALGYKPYWLDLAGFDATGSKMIREQNDMYSLASRISQKSRLFNHFVWEPLNSEGFKALSYNAKDQKNSELLVPLFNSIPKDIPYIATHVWPSQAAVHAGMTHVVNAIPDNWPMALHLSEGAIHAVQTPFAYLGYKMLNGFSKSPLKGIPEDKLKMTGCYVDHELLVNLKEDNTRRIERARNNKPIRFLLTVGGAGAGFDMFLSMVKHLMPYVKDGKAAVYINFGDHKDVFDKLTKAVDLGEVRKFFNDYDGLKKFVSTLKTENNPGVYAVYNEDIFQAVYSTNLLMPEADWLVTKPSELAYYPVPKIFMKHIGGHEVYGAINSQEYGDGTFECPTEKSIAQMIDRVLTDREILVHFAERINTLNAEGHYNGAYECVKLAASSV
ncbi:MAG: hypothetical protein J5857_05490 [Treponema sp.]|nr:hypothetical protein [Treponema sp.]